MQSVARYIAFFAKNRDFFEKLQFKFVSMPLNISKLAELHHKNVDRLG